MMPGSRANLLKNKHLSNRFRKTIQFLIFLGLSLLFGTSPSSLKAQSFDSFWAYPDTLKKNRLLVSSASGIAIYGAVSIGLWQTWYKDYPLSRFHLFDDWGEWRNFDKVGHLTTAYIESRYIFNGALWTGMDRNKAMWTGAAVGTGLQLTLEIMDGFSEKWGFSLGDVGFNTAGVLLFVGQEMYWKEQRIKMKISTHPYSYPKYEFSSVDGSQSSSLIERKNALYGSGIFETFLKDYNQQKNWASINIWSFLKDRKHRRFPKWLNVAVGYGVGNIYGGYRNVWQEGEATFALDNELYPRYHQFLLSLDVDLSQIRTKSHFWNMFFDAINWIKIPAPTIEFNSLGQVKFHGIY